MVHKVALGHSLLPYFGFTLSVSFNHCSRKTNSMGNSYLGYNDYLLLKFTLEEFMKAKEEVKVYLYSFFNLGAR